MGSADDSKTLPCAPYQIEKKRENNQIFTAIIDGISDGMRTWESDVITLRLLDRNMHAPATDIGGKRT